MDTPDLNQLGRIASTVKRQYWPDGSMPCGISHEDLIAEGFLAYVQAHQFPWARARFAMLDHIKATLIPVSGSSLYRMRHLVGTSLNESLEATEPDRSLAPIRRMHLKRGDVNALRTFCHRVLSPRKARVMIMALIEGESIEVIADRLGITRERAVMIRSQAIGEMRDHLNN
jgi:DNA-directed RNA polymerase specialized sigma24 family protein